MKIPLVAVCALLLCASLPAQNTSLVAWSGLAGSGTNCDPWTCVPALLAASRGSTLGLMVAGSTGQPHFLLAALPPAQCRPVAGVTGALIVQPPVVAMYLPLSWGRIYVTPAPGQASCSGWRGFGSLTLPANLPPGLQFLIQTLSVPSVAGLPPALSNAVQVTVR